jgi:hypothetical protein
MKATLIKVDSIYHLWLNPNTKDQEHIASDNPIVDTRGVDFRKYKLSKQKCDEIFGVTDKEIEVEIEQVNKLNIDKGIFEWMPKLDEDGCLILKKL